MVYSITHIEFCFSSDHFPNDCRIMHDEIIVTQSVNYKSLDICNIWQQIINIIINQFPNKILQYVINFTFLILVHQIQA